MNSTGYYKHILKCSEQMEDGRMILFDPDSGKTHVLNATAVKIYRLCTNTEPEGIAPVSYTHLDVYKRQK